jgi:hypothetical protein
MSALTEIYVDNVVRHLPEEVACRHRRRDHRDDRATWSKPASARARTGVPGSHGRHRTRSPRRARRSRRRCRGSTVNSPQHLIGPKSYLALSSGRCGGSCPSSACMAVLTNVVVTVATDPRCPSSARPDRASTVGNTVTALLTAFAVITIIIALGDRGRDGNAHPPHPSGSDRPTTWTIDDLDRRDIRIAGRPAPRRLSGWSSSSRWRPSPSSRRPCSTSATSTAVRHVHQPGPRRGLAGRLLGASSALLAAVEIIRFVTASARPTVALIGGVIDVAMAVFLTIALLTQPVLHPELTSAANADMSSRSSRSSRSGSSSIWDQVSTWRIYRRNRR